MAKKAGKKASKSHSASEKNPNKKESLKLKSTEKTKRTSRSIRVGGIENDPISAKKSKAIPKKKEGRNKPKKPPTAFFYFLEDFRKEYQLQNPKVKSMRDVGKACGEKWSTMRYEEKFKYYDIATEKRAEFDEAMAEYERKKASGEDQDDLEDSKLDEY